MTRLLAEHGETLCHADSDAADAISSILGRYSDGKDTATESLWLKAYGGEQVLVARKKEGLVLLEEPCLSVRLSRYALQAARALRHSATLRGGPAAKVLLL